MIKKFYRFEYSTISFKFKNNILCVKGNFNLNFLISFDLKIRLNINKGIILKQYGKFKINPILVHGFIFQFL